MSTNLIPRHLVRHVGAHQDAHLRGRGAQAPPNHVRDEHKAVLGELQALFFCMF